jgi:FMN reductase
MSRRIVVISAGLSQPSSTRLLADRLAASTAAAIDGDLAVHTVELREIAHEITDAILTGFAAPALQQVLDELAGADGVIAVTPTFNASYGGLFKSFFDVVGTELLTDSPVLLAATGGTERHSLVLEHAMRPMFSYLHAATVPLAVYAASSDWGSNSAALGDRIVRAGRQFAGALVASTRTAPRDEFANVTPFEQLLAG